MVAARVPGGEVSVFGRLRGAIILAFAIGFCLAVVAAWAFTTAAAREAYDRLLISAATQIAETIDVENGQVIAHPPDAAFETLALAPDDRFFYSVRDPSGRLVTGYEGLPTGDPRRLDRGPAYADRRFSGAQVRLVTIRRYIAQADRPGAAVVTVAQTTHARQDMTLDLLGSVIATIAFVSLVGLGTFLVLARQALAPLVRIEQHLATRAPHDLSPITGGYPQEIQNLVGTINRMMGQVAERLERLQTFTAVAAHQIRTPLAALLAQVELMKEPGVDAAYRRRVENLRGRVGELSRLANQLLGHAMVAYRDETAPRTPVDLVRLVQDATNRSMPQTLTRDVDIGFQAPDDDIVVLADTVMLEEAVTNLFDNALRHGAATRITVSVAADGEEAVVAIRDDGPGIPSVHWTEAVQPFALRHEERRSGGAGLGLSIAQAVASAHGGRLAFARRPDGDFEVAIRLPRTEGETP